MANAENRSVGQAVEVMDPTDEVRMIIDSFEAERLGLVQAADLIEVALKAKGLLQRMSIPPTLVGVDPGNRDSEGVNALECASLASDICEVGWSWKACSHASCVEQQPGTSDTETFTRALCVGTDLPDVDEGSIKFGAFAGAHTNMLLRAIGAGAPSTHATLSNGARYSLESLEQRDKEFARAVRSGLQWTVFHWKVKVMYPKVVQLVQSARNVGATLNRKESEMQTLLRMHSLGKGFMALNLVVPWAKVLKDVQRSRPPAAHKLEGMKAFVIARSGGLDGEHLRFLSVFHRNCINASLRSGVPTVLYEALAEFPKHLLALALLETAWTCPAANVHNGECCWVGKSEVDALAKAPASSALGLRVAAADRLLDTSRKLVMDLLEVVPCSWPNDVIVQVTVFDVKVGRYVLDKGNKYASLAKIATELVSDLVKLVKGATAEGLAALLDIDEGNLRNTPTASGAAPKAKAKAKAATGPDTHMYQLSATGQIEGGTGRLRAAGWDTGSTVTLTVTPDGFETTSIFIVEAITAGQVLLALMEDASRKVAITIDAFVATATALAADRLVRNPSWPGGRIARTTTAADTFMKARVWFALYSLIFSAGRDVADLVDIFLKPVKSVRARKDLASGDLVLLPEAVSIKLLNGEAADDEALKTASAEVFLEGGQEEFASRIFVQGSASGEVLSPYWCLQQADRSDEVNMVPVTYRVHTIGGADPWPRDPSLKAKDLATGTAATASGEAPATKKQRLDESGLGEATDNIWTKAALAKPPPLATAKPPPNAGRLPIISPPKAPAAQAKADAILPSQRALVQAVQNNMGRGNGLERYVYFSAYANCKPVQTGETLRIAKVARVVKAKAAGPVGVVQVVKRARLAAEALAAKATSGS